MVSRSSVGRNCGRKYRVLSIDGTKALVLGLYDVTQGELETYSSNNIEYISAGDAEIVKYEDSDIDTYLEYWYEHDTDLQTDDMNEAIIPTDIVQRYYLFNQGNPTGQDYSFKSSVTVSDTTMNYYLTDKYPGANIQQRHVFALDIKDIINYLGKDGSTSDTLKEMYGNTSGKVWLRSVSKAVENVIGNAIDFAKNLLGIQSPSKVFMEIGVNTGLGYVKGINKEKKNINKAFDSLLPTNLGSKTRIYRRYRWRNQNTMNSQSKR